MQRVCLRIMVSSLALGVSLSAMSSAQAGTTLGEAIMGGKPIIDLRARYERVNQDGFAHDANAYTGRARVGYETGTYEGFSMLSDVDLIGHLGADDFNDTVNGRAAYPTVVDHDIVELNRLQIAYEGLPDTIATLGRQRIILGNARFVGNVGWRQNEQTFDALNLVNTSFDGFTLGYTYVNRVNRVFSDDSRQGHYQGDSHFFNADYKGIGVPFTVSAYGYLLDLENATSLSTATYGVRAAKPFILEDMTTFDEATTLTVTGEYAHQSDYAMNPLSLDLDYYLGELELKRGQLSLLGGYEILGSNGTTGFSTPLATLHAFNGWADTFLTTPAKGLKDAYVTSSYALTKVPYVAKVILVATYHDFSSQKSGIDYGHEVDLMTNVVMNNEISLNVKYANYNGANGFADRDKLWVGVTYAF